MNEVKTNYSLKIIVLVTFLIMIIVNSLANILPINGRKTGEISDYYQNLFAPAGFTFAIWGLIYFLLAVYTIYQLGIFQKYKSKSKEGLFQKIGLYFSISSLANTAWIFAWHYNKIPLSMLLMIVILICLIVIIQTIGKEQLSFKEQLLIRLPFSVYFGWITVATIANATILLVSQGWNGFGISEPVWAVIIITLGMIIGIATMIKNKDIAYGLVLIWAYVGIMIKHLSANGFDGQYPAVITTVLVCILLLLIADTFLIRLKLRKRFV